MINKIKQIINEDYNRLVSIRRDIHSHPELGLEEFRTQELIIKELEKLSCYKITKSAKTGVVALIKGTKDDNNNKCVGLRADIDALPIEDMKNVEYKSQNKGEPLSKMLGLVLLKSFLISILLNFYLLNCAEFFYLTILCEKIAGK